MLKLNKYIILYILIIPLLFGIIFINYQKGRSDFWDLLISLSLSILVILDVSISPKWANVRNSSKGKRTTATVILTDLLGENIIFFGFKINILWPVMILFALIFYFKLSEKFLSKAFESGGLLWKGEKEGGELKDE